MNKNITQPDKPKFVFIGDECIGEIIDETENYFFIEYKSMYNAIHEQDK
jgi:hypothetical protein